VITTAVLLEDGRATAASPAELNIYDTIDHRWHQTADNSGSLLMLAGQLIDRSMVMSSDPTDPGDRAAVT
jgi:hypothetical protein